MNHSSDFRLPTSFREHLISPVDGPSSRLVVFLQLNAQVRHMVQVVLRPGFEICHTNGFLAGVFRHAEDGVGVERFLRNDCSLAASTRVLLLSLSLTRALALADVLPLVAAGGLPLPDAPCAGAVPLPLRAVDAVPLVAPASDPLVPRRLVSRLPLPHGTSGTGPPPLERRRRRHGICVALRVEPSRPAERRRQPRTTSRGRRPSTRRTRKTSGPPAVSVWRKARSSVDVEARARPSQRASGRGDYARPRAGRRGSPDSLPAPAPCGSCCRPSPAPSARRPKAGSDRGRSRRGAS